MSPKSYIRCKSRSRYSSAPHTGEDNWLEKSVIGAGSSGIEIATPRSSRSVGGPTPRTRIRRPLSLVAGVLASIVLGQIALSALPLGPRATHMASHILLLNAAAPALALVTIAVYGAQAPVFLSAKLLAAATFLQLALLWTWHAPIVLALAARQPIAHALMQAALLAASLGFWLAVLSEEGVFRWRGVIAILLTGKLSCLLGVLLLLAPRLLYADIASDHGHGAADVDGLLSDQRLAGLLMLAACPLCYVLTGVAIASKSLRDLERIGAEQRPTFSISSDVSMAPR